MALRGCASDGESAQLGASPVGILEVVMMAVLGVLLVEKRRR